MHRPALFLSLIAALASDACAENAFSVPGSAGTDKDYSDDPVYKVGDSITFKWTSDYSKVGILLWQQYPDLDAGNSITLLSDSSSTALTWKVSRDWLTDVDDDETAVAYLALYESGSTSLSVISHYINITAAESSSSSSSIASTTSAESTKAAETKTIESKVTVTQDATITSSAVSTNIVTTDAAGGLTTILVTATGASEVASTTSTSTNTGSSSSGSSFSTGKTVGIAIGSILGALSALGGGGYAYRRKRRARKAAKEAAFKMQQQSNQSTQIHISQAAPAPAPTPSPPAPPVPGYAVGQWSNSPQHNTSEMPTQNYQRNNGHGYGGAYETP